MPEFLDRDIFKGVVGQRDMLYFSIKYALEKVHQPNFQVVAAHEYNDIEILEFFKDITLDSNYFKGG